MTDTPFTAGHFDLLVGQFALEYGDPPRVLDEVRRLLRPGGGAAFVLHLQESEVVATGVVELAQLRATQPLFAAAGSVLAASAAAAPAWVQLRAWNAFGRELLRLERMAEAHPERWPVATLREVPATIRDLVTAAVPEPGATIGPSAAHHCRRSLADFCGLLANQAERLAALLAVAPDRSAVERLLRCARRRGLQLIERADLRDRTDLTDRAGRPAVPEALLAHAITLRRLPGS